jgi:hypothetical protein
LVGKDSIADALLRYFGSLKTLSRASFKELRQFLPKGKAEAVMAALSISNIADAEQCFIDSSKPDIILRSIFDPNDALVSARIKKAINLALRNAGFL